MKTIILGGVTNAVLGTSAALIYMQLYTYFLGVDFSHLITPYRLSLTFLFAGFATTIVYRFLYWKYKRRTDAFFNPLLVIGCFATAIIPFLTTLPLEIEQPELFPGMMGPLHFFPALSWFITKPFFAETRSAAY